MPSSIESSIKAMSKPSVSGCIGITSYIKRCLMKGKEFKVGGPYIKTPAGKSRACSDKGLFIGRTTDHQLCKYYTRKLRKLTDPRAKRIAAHLELKLKLKVIAAQIPVTLPEFKLKTSIDLLAIKPPDTAVVLEIKTTQFSLSAHNDRYKRQCIGTPLLQNGIPNCESSHHQLQTAFGILGLKRLLPSDAKVIGRVVVATDEAVQSYPCSESYIKRAHFSLPMQDAMMAKSMAAIRAKLMRLPAAKDSQLKIQRYFQKLGYPLICEGLKCEASFVLSDAVGDPKAKPTKYAVIAMIHDPDNSGMSTVKYTKAREVVNMATTKLMKKLKTKSVKPFVLRFNSRTGRLMHHAVRYTSKNS